MKFSINVLLLVISVQAWGQLTFVTAEASYGTYSMHDQKTMQQDFANILREPDQKIDAFRPSFGYGLSAGVRVSKRASLGLSFSTASTRGLIAVADSTSTLTFQQSLTCYSIGMFYQIKMNHSDAWPVGLIIHTSYIRTQLHADGTNGQSGPINIFKAVSDNVGFRPGIFVMHPIGHFVLKAEGGYEFQIHGDLHQPGNKQVIVADNSGNPLSAQWDGLRLSVGFGFLIR